MTRSSYASRFTEVLSVILLIGAFLTIQTLIGGTRLLFSLPAYGVLALIAFLSIASLRRPKPEANWFCLTATLVFMMYIVVRAWFSPVDYLARSDIYSVLAGLIVYFLTASFLTESKRRMVVFGCLLVFALFQVGVGAIQFKNGDNFMPFSFLQRYDYGRRASGLYVCPNHLAGLLEVLGVFGLSFVCWSRWPQWVKLLIAYVVAMCYLGVALTGSRGGYLSTVASLLCFTTLSLLVLWKAPRRVFWTFAIPGAVIALLISVAAVSFVRRSDVLNERAQQIFDVNNMRVDLWKAAMMQWKLELLTGTGSGTYRYYGRQFRTDQVPVDPVYVHNDYLHLLAEYGVIGAALFLVFLAAHLRNSWKNFRRLGLHRMERSTRVFSNAMALQIGALCAVVAYLIHSIFDFNLHIPANVLLMAFVFGIVANAGVERSAMPEKVGGAVIMWRLVAPVLAIVMAVQCVRLLPGEYYTERARIAFRDYELGEAVSFALKGLQSEHKNPDLYQYLGSAQFDQAAEAKDRTERTRLYEAAIETFEKGRALAPREKSFWVGLGQAYDQLGRFQEAEWVLYEARMLDPNFQPLKDLYQEHLRRWQRARWIIIK